MKYATPFTASAIMVLATLSQAKPVPGLKPLDPPPTWDAVPVTSPMCKELAPNTIKIRTDLNTQVFQDTYYKDSTIMVSSYQYNEKLYLDSIDFASTCGIAYCNKEYGLAKRDTVHVESPKGTDCIVPKASVSTFKCKGGKKGEVVVTYDSFGKASFFSTNAIAYFGSWYEKECVTAARKGKSVSTTGKDFLIVDCSDKFESACTNIPPIHE